jgi:AraC-like DNA-binding protein
MQLYFKNMVSKRCKMLVKAEIEKLGLHCRKIELGEAEIIENISSGKWDELNIVLKKSGIELMHDKQSILIEKIRIAVIERIHYADEPLEVNFSNYLSKKLYRNYNYLANVFSATQGITFERFYLMHKIERVKQLMIYDDLNLKEIAWKMNYSSTAHLSNQFKKITGISPSIFKKNKDKQLCSLRDI